jgi:hypothetical protein
MLTLFFLSKQRPPAEGAAQIFEKLSQVCLLLFLSQQRPSAEGAAKIFERFIPQMEKNIKSCLNAFFPFE